MRHFFVIAFLLSILAANWAVSAFEPVPVGFGLYAPAGVYLVALTLVLRDLVQRLSGPRGLVFAGVGGIALSFALADPAVVWASLVAFTVSFLIDTLIYTAFVEIWGSFVWAILISGFIALIFDTWLFTSIAGLEEYAPGQLLGKAYGTILAAVVIALWTRRDQKTVSVRSE